MPRHCKPGPLISTRPETYLKLTAHLKARLDLFDDLRRSRGSQEAGLQPIAIPSILALLDERGIRSPTDRGEWLFLIQEIDSAYRTARAAKRQAAAGGKT